VLWLDSLTKESVDSLSFTQTWEPIREIPRVSLNNTGRKQPEQQQLPSVAQDDSSEQILKY
jgi:hypothetical protein